MDITRENLICGNKKGQAILCCLTFFNNLFKGKMGQLSKVYLDYSNVIPMEKSLVNDW
jgi:hypothetical protein